MTNRPIDGGCKSTEQRIEVLFRGCQRLETAAACFRTTSFHQRPLCPPSPTLTPETTPLAAFCRHVFSSLPSSYLSQRMASLTPNGILGLSVRNGGVPGKMLTGVTQPSLCHQAAAIINECIKRSTQGAKKVDNDLCLPKGKIT